MDSVEICKQQMLPCGIQEARANEDFIDVPFSNGLITRLRRDPIKIM